jgi:cell division protein FtsI (penicillin-binding protein 3)
VTIYISLFLIVAFLALGVRCLYLQTVRVGHYLEASLKQEASRKRQPQRGVILDGRGRVLAASNEIQTIFADPSEIKDAKETSSALAPIVDIGAHIICQTILESRSRRFVRIKNSADPNEYLAAHKIHGIGSQPNWQRHYPMGRLVSNVVGFTSTEGGLEGIELKYDKALTGSPARNIFFADVRRRPIRPKQQEGVLTNGVGIILTIDSTIQQFARGELAARIEEYQAESGVAIVAEPRSGAILAMVSLPDFDPAEFGTTDPSHFRSRALTDSFEPGSILKAIVSAIALDAGVVNTTETIFCENGDYRGVGFGSIGEYDDRGYGDLTLRGILINSSNIGMAKIGQRLGKQRLYEGLKLFRFGEKTGIELPGEVIGRIRPLEDWDGYSVTRVPFGQEISVTAIQLIRAFSILANGGRLVSPFLVRAVVDSSGRVTELKRPPPPVGYIVKPEIAEWLVTEAMVSVVNEGRANRRAKLEKWQVFGKSGTANIAEGGVYSQRNYVSSFICGAPAEDPAVVVLVSIRKPNKSLGKGYTGGIVSSPAAAKIIERTLTYLGVE